MGYSPLDDGLPFSTVNLFGGPLVLAVWALILADKDRDGITKLNPDAVYRQWLESREPRTLDEVKAAWEYLAAPDPKSKSQEYEGRRIVPTDDGRWHVVNSEKYRERYSSERRRRQLAEAQRRHREKKAGVEPAPAGRDGAAEHGEAPLVGTQGSLPDAGPNNSCPAGPTAAPSLPHDLRPGPRVSVVNGLTGERRPLEEAFEPHPEIPTPAARLAIERECGELVLEVVRLERPEVDNLAVVMSATEWRGDSKTRLDRLSNERLLHTRVRLRERAARARAAAAKAEEEARVIEHYRQQREEKGA